MTIESLQELLIRKTCESLVSLLEISILLLSSFCSFWERERATQLNKIIPSHDPSGGKEKKIWDTDLHSGPNFVISFREVQSGVPNLVELVQCVCVSVNLGRDKIGKLSNCSCSAGKSGIFRRWENIGLLAGMSWLGWYNYFSYHYLEKAAGFHEILE